MIYSTSNLTLSFYRQFAEMLQEAGYNITWYASKETEYTSVDPAKGTITLVPEFPANATQIVRLITGSPGEQEVVIPAFALQVPDGPRKIARLGLGDSTFEREREIRIDGFATDSYEHRELTDLLYDWLQGGDKRLDVWDYGQDMSNPPLLDPVQVWYADVARQELTQGDEGHRYYINLVGSVRYFE